MNITRRKLLVRLVQAICALPLIGVRIAKSDSIHGFMFQQKGWATMPMSIDEYDCEHTMLASGIYLSAAFQQMLAECRRDGFVPRKIGIKWIGREGFENPIGHFELEVIRERVE